MKLWLVQAAVLVVVANRFQVVPISARRDGLPFMNAINVLVYGNRTLIRLLLNFMRAGWARH